MTQERIVELAINTGLKEAFNDNPSPGVKELMELLGRGVATYILRLGWAAGLTKDERKEWVRKFGESLMNAEIEIKENKQNDRRRN